MGETIEQVPCHWDNKGKILKWTKASNSSQSVWDKRREAVTNLEGKHAFMWDDHRVLLWRYTLPHDDWERVSYSELKPGHGVMFLDHAARRPIKRLTEGALADYPVELRALGNYADSLRAMECHLRGQPDPWSDTIPENTVRNRKSMRSHIEHRNWMWRFLGRHLYEWIVNRDSDMVGLMAKMLSDAKGLCLSDFFGGADGVWHDADSLRGTVYRCWRIISAMDSESLPTKRGLREYVIQEWEAMGNSRVTVETEFSAALKDLGLSKLPNGMREKSTKRRIKKNEALKYRKPR